MNYTEQQQNSINALEAKGFKLSKPFTIHGEVIANMNKKYRTGGTCATISEDGTVNGEELKEYLKRFK